MFPSFRAPHRDDLESHNRLSQNLQPRLTSNVHKAIDPSIFKVEGMTLGYEVEKRSKSQRDRQRLLSNDLPVPYH